MRDITIYRAVATAWSTEPQKEYHMTAHHWTEEGARERVLGWLHESALTDTGSESIESVERIELSLPRWINLSEIPDGYDMDGLVECYQVEDM